MVLIAKGIDEIPQVAEEILKYTRRPAVFLFFADMGTGKTTLIKALCQALGVPAQDISSPTFSIVNQYMGKEGEVIYHFDFYRLRDETEAYDLGYEDYFYSGHFCFVEWSEKIPNLWPPDHIKIHMKTQADRSRLITLEINEAS
ncbi:tRNA (adenosine(37)-N6)-threonylcarbamoyltransferase complex ATPase subunit type 1 TsaE [Olivibacter sitiensis]|uniref:tRNA (adenosine(37)-N6)-threonylcarbamoyltransferase complex ATPase subunit type 1 TsaE n=1 Tax=Olivibacter sitiensis TaxID=376470 RepID=UPI0003F6AD27|nr:tRNA (adenosine(37)-N6)-threonylcarbamoyltransferase complex ATPase subunit type 1 TsaE [Olivibacter sitiensis]